MIGRRNCFTIFKRELRSYFESPVAYVFLFFFLALIGFLTFSVMQFYERRQADLQPFFLWFPWVYLLLVPAATMGLWAEERRTGSVELLLTMPITMTDAILGKFFAAWAFLSLGVVLTFPVVLTVIHLGNPDLGVVLAGYVGAILMAGAYVAVGMLASSVTRSQVIAFVLALGGCLLLVVVGWPPVTNFFVRWAPAWFVEGLAAFSFMPHFESIQRGVLDLRDIVYYLSVIGFTIFATHVVVENRKSA